MKLGGIVEGMQENALVKEFFGSINNDQVQINGPQVSFLGRGDG